MKVINMFNIHTGEIRPTTPDIENDSRWLKIHNGWQPQYDINNQYMGYKTDRSEFRDMRRLNVE